MEAKGSLFMELVNLLSIISLLLLMAGAFMLVLQGGLFNGFLHSCRRFIEHSTKQGEYASRFHREGKRWKEWGKFRLTYPLLLSGGILFIFTYVCSILMH
ncbi:DUF3899 domain-containing protein [Paenibacillus sp. DMB20]|uniref:DUF3899 domain-containing protein n=1 Tax=Paenibacillus sp. DMB20 TaxID=1642570 RepID=UPI00062817BC|nr:DUF3899 domain-containing protein [Paenibacillus sp. DMB20]KKO53492.1 hypothetical protein XI25_12970 [Paenibacillus sp. DMB20]